MAGRAISITPRRAVQLPGEFAARGGILDMFAADWDDPVRIELFGDEVESIRRFDLSSQRSIASLDEIDITVLQPDARSRARSPTTCRPGPGCCWSNPSRRWPKPNATSSGWNRPQGFASPRDVNRALWQFPLPDGRGDRSARRRIDLPPADRIGRAIQRRHRQGPRRTRPQRRRRHDVFLVAKTEAERQRLGEIFADTTLAQAGSLHLLVGTLCEGFRLVRERVILISGGELFHRGELRRLPRRHLGKAIDSFLDLREGDLVVHLAHGIGRYRGMRAAGQARPGRRAPADRVPRRHEDLRAGHADRPGAEVRRRHQEPPRAGQDRQQDLGPAESRPPKRPSIDLAAEMLEMQAAAAGPARHLASPPDADWQREFDASFPYDGNARSADRHQAIKHDMHAARPMDRLLCGDVGFGKTEVAMRAAFKAVDNGYQVAVLVPTTMLAEQHFHTFRERMAEFPFDIARLSRFCSPARTARHRQRPGHRPDRHRHRHASPRVAATSSSTTWAW